MEFLKKLADHDKWVRYKVCWELGDESPEVALPVLGEQLEWDSSPMVREACAMVLGDFGIKAKPFLLKGLKDRNPWVRMAVKASLDQIEEEEETNGKN